MNSADVLATEFEALKNELIAKHDELGMRASRRWAASLEVEVSGTGAALLADYSLDGRGPGKQPPSEAIEQWLTVKGIAEQLGNEISISSLAFLIARKIGREGWKQKNGIDPVDSVITPERIQQVLDRVGDSYILHFTNEILNYLKTAA